MKKFFLPMMIIAIFIAFYEQNSAKPNVYITIISIAVFAFGLMKLSAKIPPKNDPDDNSIL